MITAEAAKLHSLLRTQKEQSALHHSSVSKASLKKPVQIGNQNSEQGQVKGAGVGSTSKEMKLSDLAHLKQLAYASCKYTTNSMEKTYADNVNLTRPYQFSFFSKL